MMQGDGVKKSGPDSGWILVTGLVLICVIGTWLTVWNYRQHVFSSARGIVLENQRPESRISVELTLEQARRVQSGQVALITARNSTQTHKGSVVSVTPETRSAVMIIRLLDESGDAERSPGSASSMSRHYLKVGTVCGVTIDTTVPPIQIGTADSESK